MWDVTCFSNFSAPSCSFLLTHPVWDVTYSAESKFGELKISTHTSRVGCDAKRYRLPGLAKISTHTSRVGCDILMHPNQNLSLKFLLTHPVWDVTYSAESKFGELKISTHTSRVGCDDNDYFTKIKIYDFYSHIPCGMWRLRKITNFLDFEFLLTHPVWDVTEEIYV